MARAWRAHGGIEDGDEQVQQYKVGGDDKRPEEHRGTRLHAGRERRDQAELGLSGEPQAHVGDDIGVGVVKVEGGEVPARCVWGGGHAA